MEHPINKDSEKIMHIRECVGHHIESEMVVTRRPNLFHRDAIMKEISLL